MVAFGTGDLSGILNGLSLGTDVVYLLMRFKYFIFGLVMLYGVIHWGNYFTSKDALRSFSDFLKAGLWFSYVILVFTLFAYSYNGKLFYIPTTLDVSQLASGSGVEVNGPNGQDFATGKANQEFKFRVPSVFSLLDIIDAPVYEIAYFISVEQDPTAWGAYAGNSLSPTRIFDKCFTKTMTGLRDYGAGKDFICGLADTHRTIAGVNIPLTSTNSSLDQIYKALDCKYGLRKALSDPAVKARIAQYQTCVGDAVLGAKSRIKDQEAQLLELKNEGKLSEGDYNKKVDQLGKLSNKFDKEYHNLAVNYLPTWRVALLNAYNSNPESFDKFTAVNSDSLSPASSTLRDVVEYFSRAITDQFVGEHTLLAYAEAVIKFMLTLEIGITFPVLILLSMIPNDRGNISVSLSYLWTAVLTYGLIRFMRIGILLMYLVAHNYFLSQGV